MRFSNALQSVALFSTILIANVSAFALEPRAAQAATCAGLSVKSNDGNRKVALVLDSSGSMTSSDPYNLRRAAGRALNDWLVTNAQASGSRKADLVTVIDFDGSARVVYPLGDPGGANSSFDSIDSSGGTYIAGGVMSAISQLTKPGSGDTKSRTSIIVFTDGEDSSVSTLVNQIKTATSLGIRVSFGFLDLTSATQSKSVLEAIKASGGVYATITTGDASNNFINFAILNGLTQNDNPSGNANTLLAGLSVTYPISQGSVFYNAQSGEHIRFTVKSIDAGPLSVDAVVGGKTANTTTTSTYGSSYLFVTTPDAGQIEIKVSAKSPSSSSPMYVLGATSDMPIQNCTIAVVAGPPGGLSTGGKVAVGICVPLLVGLLGLGGFFLLKKFGHMLPKFKMPFSKTPPAGGPAAPPAGGEQAPGYFAEKPGFTTPNTYPVSPGTPYTPQMGPPGNGYPPASYPPQQPYYNMPPAQQPYNPTYNMPPQQPYNPNITYPPAAVPPNMSPNKPAPGQNDGNQDLDRGPYDGNQGLNNVPPNNGNDGLNNNLPPDNKDFPNDGNDGLNNPGDSSQPPNPDKPELPHDKHRRIRKFRLKNNIPLHHHHIHDLHPCWTAKCKLAEPGHRCEVQGRCACTDEDCPMNEEGHDCEKKGRELDEHPTCGCVDEECEVYKECVKKGRVKMMGNAALQVGKMGVGSLVG